MTWAVALWCGVTEAKTEHYVQLQRRKSLKYAEKQHFQDYLTVPIEFSRFLELQPSQTMKCAVNGKGVLVYTAVEQKPVTERLTYQKWLEIVARLTPTTTPGKTYTQIRKEGGITLQSAPAIWVQRARHDIGLTRGIDPKTRQVMWTRTRPPQIQVPRLKSVQTRLVDLAISNHT